MLDDTDAADEGILVLMLILLMLLMLILFMQKHMLERTLTVNFRCISISSTYP